MEVGSVEADRGITPTIAHASTGTVHGLHRLRGTFEKVPAELASTPVLVSLGFRVREVPSGDPDKDPALLIDQVVADSPAYQAGLRPGMRIVAVGRNRVGSKSEYDAAVAAIRPEQGLPLQIETPDGQAAFVTVGGPGRR